MTVSDEDLKGYEAFLGREAEGSCVIAPESCDLMAATLDRDDPPFSTGDPIPPMWIWMGFRPHARRSELGPDGHPARGGFLPPVALPRRMFAGARHRFIAPLPCGETIVRRSRIAAVTPKRGASGAMVFVTVAQTYLVDGAPRLEEEQDIVYREAARPGEAPVPAEPDKPIPAAPWAETYVPDVVTLLRYSALTFNGHRIHYDRPYATQEEGYPGLVVHGPLTATLLADMVRRHAGRDMLAGWEFRARKPLFDISPIALTGTPAADGGSVELAAYDAGGALAMTAKAVFEAPT